MCSWLSWLERWLAGVGGWRHAWGPRFNPCRVVTILYKYAPALISNKYKTVDWESPFLLSVCQEAGIDCRVVWARADACWDSRPGRHATGGVGRFLNKSRVYTSPNKYILSVQTERTDRSHHQDYIKNVLLVYSFWISRNLWIVSWL